MLESAKPQLRLLEIRPQQHEGRRYFRLRDPQQISNKVLLVPQTLAALLSFCDGTRTPHTLMLDFAAQYGSAIPMSIVDDLLATLDEALMLENERTAQARAQALLAYRQAHFRPPALAGLSYPAEASALWHLLQDYLEEVEEIPPLSPDWSSKVGLLSPHIDYPRGGKVYAEVWQRAAQAAREAELVVLFGTDHHGGDRFTLTRQNYATPYGLLPTYQPLINRLAEIIGEEAAFAGELRHRTEHSLELVAVWLHHMRGGAPVELVPILAGGFQHFLENGTTPAHDPQIHQVIEAIRQETVGRRVLVVASGDLAHVGSAFHGPPLNPAGREQVRTSDRDLITHMQAGDPEFFFGAIQQIRDQNNVCGVSPIYLTLRALGTVQGELRGYAICPADEHGTSVVTICGMVFQ
jgi:MEMO1 family protein